MIRAKAMLPWYGRNGSGGCPPLWIGLLVAILSPAITAQGVGLQADFDHASLDLAGSSVNGSLVQLAGRDNHNPGDWKWLYFAATEVEGQALTFRIGDNFETGSGSLSGHSMVYSYDQQSWQFFDNNVWQPGSDSFTFWNDAPFSQPVVYVAYGLPYPLSRSITHTAQLQTSPWVTPTLTAEADFVIGQSPGGVDDLGRVIPPHDVYGYRIADPAGATSRTKVVLAGGVHANETLGNFALEGLVDFLVSDAPEAQLLRKYAEFYVYPMINPDGRFAGYNRSTVADESQDPNRYWVPGVYGGIEELVVAGSAMINDVGIADYLVDFHSTVNGKTGHFGFVLPSMQSDPLWQALLSYEPEIDTRDAALVDDTLAKFGRDRLGANFSITFETQFLAGENIDRFLDLGRSFGLAFADTLTLFGDLDLDGLLGLGDYETLLMFAESDLSGLSPIDAYLRGDLDGDGQNNIADFAILKDAFETQLGFGALGRLLAPVPEPAAATSLLLAICLYIVVKRTHHFERAAHLFRS